jgi:hypothetical protein
VAFDWEILPDAGEVHTSLMRQADLKARLKIAKLELEIYQAELVRSKPRDTSVKLIGIDDETRARVRELLQRVIDVEVELDTVDAQVKFNNHRVDAAKMLAYKTRM